ncbi:MAG: hypothetical protein Q7T13_03080, partial [Polaromonas sp.]|nr:hypothetical protein [Polaromonas sp.]
MNARENAQAEGPVSRADNPSGPQLAVPPVTPPPGPASPARGAAGRSHTHESARAQVAGAATYVDDIPEVRGTL